MHQLYNGKTNYDYKRNLGASFQKKNLNLSLNLKMHLTQFSLREKKKQRRPLEQLCRAERLRF